MQLKKFTAGLWGQKYTFTPYLVDRKWGDGKQFIAVSPMMIRPYFYVVRVDSKASLEGDRWPDQLETIRDSIDEEYGPCCDEYSDRGECCCDHHASWPATFEWGGSTWRELDDDDLVKLGLIQPPGRRRYKYRSPRPGVWAIEPTPKTGSDAKRFRSQARRIAIELFGEGALLNRNDTEQGDVQFQGVQAVHMAHHVGLVWRRRHGRQPSPHRKVRSR